MPRFAAPRTALLPAFQDTATADLIRALAESGSQLEALIVKQQLGPLWHARTKAAPFAESRANAAMLYMRQAAALREIDDHFERRGVRYAIFKGAAIREQIYDDPSTRVCWDIDVLVAPDQRAAAAKALVDAGYRLRVDPALASHEVALARDLVAIDLHWDLLRPGRAPASLTGQMLERRHWQGERWILGETDALFVLLVHPAFSKHLSTSQMGLHRLADIVLWLQQHNVDWPALHQQLDASGLKTAAWTMLSLVRMLSPDRFAQVVERPLRSLRPNAVRAAYLRNWLNRDLSARFTHLHMARLLGLSVFLHDQPAGAWRALRGWQRSRTTRGADVLAFGGIEQATADVEDNISQA
jgi:hypothetical protein